jgi:hypothetical protein
MVPNKSIKATGNSSVLVCGCQCPAPYLYRSAKEEEFFDDGSATVLWESTWLIGKKCPGRRACRSSGDIVSRSGAWSTQMGQSS